MKEISSRTEIRKRKKRELEERELKRRLIEEIRKNPTEGARRLKERLDEL